MSTGLQPSTSRAGAPTVNDDFDHGFVKWSGWVDTSTVPDSLHVCVDPTPGGAVWLPVGAVPAPSSDTLWDKRTMLFETTPTGGSGWQPSVVGAQITRGPLTASTDATACFAIFTGGWGCGPWSGPFTQPRFLPEMLVAFKTPPAPVANATFVIGFKTAEDATTNPPTVNSACLFYAVNTGGNWQIYTRSAAGAGTFTDSGVPWVANTAYTATMKWVDATHFSVVINGSAAIVVTATLPAVDVNLGMQCQVSNADITLGVQRMVCKSN